MAVMTDEICLKEQSPKLHLYTKKYIKGVEALFLLIISTSCEFWRRERDSNPRYAINVHTLSRRAPSTARTSLRKSEQDL